MPPRYIALQLSNPHGVPGYLISKLMNRRNAAINSFAVQQLDLRPSDRVLEIGFGGGVALPALISRCAFVAGLDRSHDVVKLANIHFSRIVEEDRAEFRVGSVGAIPYDSGAFTKVLTVNCVYFWKGLENSLKEIFRVLKPGGYVALGFLPKEHMDRMGMPADIFKSRTPDELAQALVQTGFRAIRTALPPTPKPWQVIVAER
jgi:ubiquinone/menaquinone biosynthesis C-methylase UbiE